MTRLWLNQRRWVFISTSIPPQADGGWVWAESAELWGGLVLYVEFLVRVSDLPFGVFDIAGIDGLLADLFDDGEEVVERADWDEMGGLVGTVEAA
jgi:hypothetical protein